MKTTQPSPRGVFAIEILRNVRDVGLDIWRKSGLLTQFLFLVVVILFGTAQITSRVERSIAARNMVESSLEVEQALARSILLPLIGVEPLSGRIDGQTRTAIDNAVRSNLGNGYINMIKLWGVDGQLLYSSEGNEGNDNWQEPAVVRAIKGETVISVVEENEPEHQNDPWIGDLVYEVYMPLYNSSGVLLGVGEIYCSVELLVARVDTMIGEIDRIRTMVLTFGILLLATLIFYAQRRLNRQENEILHSLRSQEALTRRNAELLAESEELRQALSDDNERFLTHIGAELHDGPIQLLSLSSLYRSQVPVAPEHAETEEKARELAKRALSDLRDISVGLILPELEGATLQKCILLAIEAFEDETHIDVPRHFDGGSIAGDKPMQVVAYRTVYESLHNARKHANGRGISVSVRANARDLTIQIRNSMLDTRGAGQQTATNAPDLASEGGLSFGLIGMAKRARSIGGHLSVEQTAGNFIVTLTLPRLAHSAPGLMLRTTDMPQAAQ